MIFKNLPNSKDLESYKERNLYYKFFAGYYFNELVPDESSRKIRFLEKLEEIIDMNSDRFKGDKVLTKGILNGLKSKEIQVTFDYHSAQIIEEDKRDDRGEMSDVLLFTDSHFISIECKFLEDMKIKKDIETVQQRIVRVKNKISKGNEIFPIQILLMVKKKWENSKHSVEASIPNQRSSCRGMVKMTCVPHQLKRSHASQCTGRQPLPSPILSVAQ